MAKDKISDYSSTANSNTDIAGINIDEGCAPSGINDAIRTLMAQLKTWQSGGQDVYIHPAGSASAPSITANGDTNTGIFFPAADTVGITTGGSERARVDSAGNLGLGVTPSTWGGNTSKVLEFANGVSFLGNLAVPAAYVNTNAISSTGGSSWTYKSTNPATQYLQFNGQHIWQYAASGTAGNAITFTQAMTLDASGNLGLGITSPVGLGSGVATLDIGGTNGGGLRFRRSGNSAFLFADGSGVDLGTNDSVYLRFITNATERARIDSSGNLLVGTTSASRYSVDFRQRVVATNGFAAQFESPASTTEATVWIHNTGTSGTRGLIQFVTSSLATVGKISTDGSTTTYGTSSDYRLKENIAPMTGALAAVAQLKPCTYTWKSNGAAGQGFIAHELQEVVPDAVVGEKDAVKEDGSIDPQGIDTSFLVATLTAAIQELKATVDAQAARITALEQA